MVGAKWALSASERSERSAENLTVHDVQYVDVNVNERQSALPDAKPEPEMGQLVSPWPTYGGSVTVTCGLTITVWPL